ncbi:MAG: hypothetical protein K2Q09_07065 [Phycisphaerales bacterium]|nr:hypothetical protein [Phycisphaerales bacterium]
MGSNLITLLNGFDPDPDAVLEEMCPRITDEDLGQMALADYGYCVDEHLAALRRIHASKRTPYPMAWEPKEVCELERWAGPIVYDPAATVDLNEEQLAAHRKRGFACAALLRMAYDDTEGRSMGENQTAAVMIATALVLEHDRGRIVAATRRTLAAIGARHDFADESERPFLALGVLLCSLAEAHRTQGRAADGRRLRSLAEGIVEAEQAVRETGREPRSDWLLGLTHYSLRHAMWRSLARHLLVEPARPHPKEADEILRLIGGMLA